MSYFGKSAGRYFGGYFGLAAPVGGGVGGFPHLGLRAPRQVHDPLAEKRKRRRAEVLLALLLDDDP